MSDFLKNSMDMLTRDIAEGAAAKEELKRLKTLIEFWIETDPSTSEITIKLSRNAQLASENFRGLVFNHSDVTR